MFISRVLPVRRGFTYALACLAAASLTANALGEPYSVAYEGNVLPEHDGWERFHGYGADEAIRYIDNGVLVIDSMHDDQVYDYVRHDASPATSMATDEFFVVEWRVLLAATESRDAGLSITLGDWTESFMLGSDRVRLSWLRINVPVAPAVWHASGLRA